METVEKNISPEERMYLIQTMINTARNKVAEDGFHLLLWGILVILCCLSNYFLLATPYSAWGTNIWLILPFIGVPLGILYERFRYKKGTVRSHFDLHIAYIWWSYSLTLVISIVFCVYTNISPVPFILLVTGMVTFATGKIINFIPLILGAIAFWICALLCITVKGPEQLLLEAGSIFLGYIVPGILLWRNAKQERHVQTA